jgi:hypothetical protein
MVKKNKKAYIISEINGIVQIGNTVYELPTGKSWKASLKNTKRKPVYEVSEKSWEGAREAWRKHIKNKNF